METCDVLIVGGGPAGSTCAWSLQRAGHEVLVIDKAVFPRDKTCAGWITPPVVAALELDIADYAQGRVFQPFHSFHIGLLRGRGLDIDFSEPVSFGIRRCEFDDYLLRRSGACVRTGVSVRSIERTSTGWLVNGDISARLLVGAGGHFCPVARLLRESTGTTSPIVTAVEAEFPIDAAQGEAGTSPDRPELFFLEDLTGYGWCVRKGPVLNIGLGLVNSRNTSARFPELMQTLDRRGAFRGELPIRTHGHAYYLYQGSGWPLVDDSLLLIGDAAGLAYAQSGEGIRPAVESALLAARTIREARHDYRAARLQAYAQRIAERFGPRETRDLGRYFQSLPRSVRHFTARRALGSSWFVKNVVIDQWFLHSGTPPLNATV